MNKSEVAYIGLGSNLGDAISNVCNANKQLNSLPGTKVVASSSLYQSSPVGYVDQADFVNAVSRIETILAPESLLSLLQGVELEFGRQRDGARWGPRTLDLDLLLYGDTILKSDSLEVPHPRMHERAFVLYPLQELAPDLRIPGQDKDIAHLLMDCTDQVCERLYEGC